MLLSLSTAQHTQQAQRHTLSPTRQLAQCRTPALDAILTRSTGTLVPTEVSPAHPHASAASLGVDAHGLEQSGEVKVRARHLRALQLEARRLHGGWVGACVGWGSVAAELSRRRRVHATHTRMHTQGTCGADAARRAAQGALQGAAQGAARRAARRAAQGALPGERSRRSPQGGGRRAWSSTGRGTARRTS